MTRFTITLAIALLPASLFATPATLIEAARTNDVAQVAGLLATTDVDATMNSVSALHVAAAYGYTEMARLLTLRALKVAPNDPLLYNNLGLISLRDGNLKAAYANFNRAVELQPDLVLPHRNIASISLRYHDYERARASLEKVTTLAPEDRDARLRKSRAG